jgi:hypothetical protein
MTAEQYNTVKDRVSDGGKIKADGFEYHFCFGSEGNLRVSEIWASREQFDKFAERLMPEITAAGIELGGAPEFFDVYSIETA